MLMETKICANTCDVNENLNLLWVFFMFGFCSKKKKKRVVLVLPGQCIFDANFTIVKCSNRSAYVREMYCHSPKIMASVIF